MPGLASTGTGPERCQCAASATAEFSAACAAQALQETRTATQLVDTWRSWLETFFESFNAGFIVHHSS